MGQGQARALAPRPRLRRLRQHDRPHPQAPRRPRRRPARPDHPPPVRRGLRPKRPHARRLPKGLKANAPGALLQIDTLSINPSGARTIKQFTAYDPIARFTTAKAFNNATSHAAAQFLDHLREARPFPVQALQVDGGSAFMAAFATACAKRSIDLYVLPPRSPEMNGAVERANGAWRYEFYACYDLPQRLDDLNHLINSFAHLYNHHRPHGASQGQTPSAYLAALTAAKTPPSQHP